MSQQRAAIDRLNELAAGATPFDVATCAEWLESCHEKVEVLAAAVEHRTVIGQAIGILSERYGIGAEAALDALSRVAEESGRKLYELSCELVETGHAEKF